MKQRFLIYIILCLISFSTYAQGKQEQDTTLNFKKYYEKKIGRNYLKSLAIPGLGQYKQKKYWKIPIIYAVGGFLAYKTLDFHSSYKDQKDLAYARVKELSPMNPDKLFGSPSVDPVFQGYYDGYHRARIDRNRTLAGLVLWYGINAMDAAMATKVPYHSAKKATLYSMTIPGLGQAYNKKYWKIPVIYAIGTGLVISMQKNNDNYHKYLKAYNEIAGVKNNEYSDAEVAKLSFVSLYGSGDVIKADGTLNESFTKNIDTYLSTMKSQKDYFRRWRDFNGIMLGLTYILNIVDAAVDAHMHDYDVSEDLSVELNPVMLPTSSGSIPGIGCVISF